MFWMRERVCNIQVFVPSIKSISSKYYNYYLHLCLPLIDCKPQEPVAVLTPILSLTIQSFPSIYFCKPTIFVCASSNTFSFFELKSWSHRFLTFQKKLCELCMHIVYLSKDMHIIKLQYSITINFLVHLWYI